ncbi:hypothetical protein RRG08_006591 [Elysia crispata]|uniref:Uncharacterized protein n=1 Tax=Elysia crispata TaxID=231223 RepID=A0AAE0YE00_9GAST|nr:hypothetical protein RRG08_006591 [Elysia crispata]
MDAAVLSHPTGRSRSRSKSLLPRATNQRSSKTLMLSASPATIHQTVNDGLSVLNSRDALGGGGEPRTTMITGN